MESHFHLQSLIGYFSEHATLALAAVFAASFLEAVAVIGTVIPGSTVAFAGGMLIGLKVIDPWVTGGVAVLGAVLGDGLSYWIGHRYRDSIRSLWPISRHPELFDRGQAYFAAHGGKSVFLARFLGPLRAIVPVIAGMSNMRAPQFYAMNILSAFGWAVVHLVPGVLFGASLQIAGAMSTRLVVLLALVAVVVWLVLFVTRVGVRIAWPYVRTLQTRILLHATGRPGVLARLVLPLVDPARRESVPLLVAATLLIGGAWLFLGVVEDIVNNDTLVRVDRSIYEALQAIRTGWVDDVMVTITALGSAYVTVAVIAAVALWLAARRHWQTLAYWLAAVAFAELLVVALKYGLERRRPDTHYASVDPYSFPSGHAALSIVVYGFLAFLLGYHKPAWQKLALAVPAVTIPALVAFSRLYLGVHWFSDVIASIGLGLSWIGLLCIAYIHHVHEKPVRTLPMAIVVFTTFAFFGTVYAHRYHERDLGRYAKTTTIRVMALGDWIGHDWQTLPAARVEFRGEHEEPFSIQWVASEERLRSALAAADWRGPADWASAASLLWLIPATPIADLPVLPKLHQGQIATLTFLHSVDARTRNVIRLWHLADVTVDSAQTEPLWAGILTEEREQTEFHLAATARTSADNASALESLAAALRSQGLIVDERALGGRPVLLVR